LCLACTVDNNKIEVLFPGRPEEFSQAPEVVNFLSWNKFSASWFTLWRWRKSV
jgi:hypothetical protein